LEAKLTDASKQELFNLGVNKGYSSR